MARATCAYLVIVDNRYEVIIFWSDGRGVPQPKGGGCVRLILVAEHGGPCTPAMRMGERYNLTMGRQVKELLEEAVALPEADRAELAGLLLETLENEPEPGVEVAWANEIERRVREIESGAVQTIPWEQVRAELYARLGEKP